MGRRFILALLLLGAAFTSLSAQTGTIAGTITDAETGSPLAGADLLLVDRDISALSASDGRFIMAGVPAGQHVLRVQRIGYRAMERGVGVSAGSTVVVDLALSSQPFSLDEIVVTGVAGRARLREIGNSVERLEIANLEARPATVSDFLQGAAPGVAVTGGSGEAGQGKQIRIRGNGSMVLSNQPLVYVDGIRMMEGAFPSEVFDRSYIRPTGAHITTSPLDLVSLGDIERIEVVKGPAATTLFGTGSANGVIQIFTKRGSGGPPRWTVDVTQGTGWVRPFGANGVDYFHVEHFLRDAWWGGGYEGGSASGPCVTDDPRWEGANPSAEGACSWPGAQWYQRYGLAVDGGLPGLSYYLSGEYQNDTYALPLDHLERYGFRANLRATPFARLELRSHTSYTHMTTANTSSGNHAEGLLLSSMRQGRSYLGSADPRDIAVLLGSRNDQWIDRLTTGLSMTYTQGPSLSHRLTLGHDFSRQDLRSVQLPGIFAPGAAATTREWARTLRTVDYLGTYLFSPGRDVRSTLSFGGQLVADDVGWTVVTGEGFENGVPTDPADALDGHRTTEESGGTRTAGLFIQNLLSVADRYFLTTGLRLDRHLVRESTFLRLDPRVGVAWVVSGEPFWPEGLGALRLRSAYGESGTAASPFLQPVSYQGEILPADPATAGAIEPEASSEWEIGLDAAFLEGRLSVGFTRYVQTTANALVRLSDDWVVGLPIRSELRNLGRIRNQGIELQVDAALVQTPEWGLDLGVGVGTNHSKLLDLGGAEAFDGLNARLMVGYPVPVSVGRRVADPNGVNGPWTNDRYLSDEEGRTSLPLGPQLPTQFINPSLSLRMPGGIIFAARGEYRGGNVRFVNPYPIGREIVSPLCLPYYVDPSSGVDLRADTPDLWRERCTPELADDYWFDGDYFKLRSVTASVPVGFAFPDAVEEATLSVVLANAYTWYREVPWWDLEVPGNEGANSDGLSTSERVPASTTLTFGLRVRF